eukprot:SAG31_NODE_24658_length_477_cov_0.494709_1_plen_57_part_01
MRSQKIDIADIHMLDTCLVDKSGHMTGEQEFVDYRKFVSVFDPDMHRLRKMFNELDE